MKQAFPFEKQHLQAKQELDLEEFSSEQATFKLLVYPNGRPVEVISNNNESHANQVSMSLKLISFVLNYDSIQTYNCLSILNSQAEKFNPKCKKKS